MNRSLPVAIAAVAIALTSGCRTMPNSDSDAVAEWHEGLPNQHKSKWLVHDLRRPKPAKVSPGATSDAAPSDAVVLFDGTDLSEWVYPGDEGKAAAWDIADGAMQLNNTGSILTKQSFRDCQLHIEWANPNPPELEDQARGNSGIFFMNRYEIQVLDNYDNPTYADGYAGGVYGQHPPIVNACRPSGEWQSYDIVFRAPRFDGDEVLEPARVTVFHNGVLTAHNAEFFGETVWRQAAQYKPEGHPDEAPIQIQDHGDEQKMRFRNIWIRRLDLSAEALDNAK